MGPHCYGTNDSKTTEPIKINYEPLLAGRRLTLPRTVRGDQPGAPKRGSL